MENEPHNHHHLMDVALRASVPMWLLELNGRDYEFLKKRAEVCSLEVASKGDVLMYGGKTGEPAKVFNRLAEGMACLLLITKHPVPFGRTVYYPDGSQKTFETEKEANNEVWPEVSGLRGGAAEECAPQSEEMPNVREGTSEEAEVNNDGGTNRGSKNNDRKNGSKRNR